MSIDPLASSTAASFFTLVGAGSALVGGVAGMAAAHPVLATVVTVGAYNLFGGSTNNPPHLGQLIDTSA